jgi:hypothetical protein
VSERAEGRSLAQLRRQPSALLISHQDTLVLMPAKQANKL